MFIRHFWQRETPEFFHQCLCVQNIIVLRLGPLLSAIWNLGRSSGFEALLCGGWLIWYMVSAFYSLWNSAPLKIRIRSTTKPMEYWINCLLRLSQVLKIILALCPLPYFQECSFISVKNYLWFVFGVGLPECFSLSHFQIGRSAFVTSSSSLPSFPSTLSWSRDESTRRVKYLPNWPFTWRRWQSPRRLTPLSSALLCSLASMLARSSFIPFRFFAPCCGFFPL